MGFGKDGKGQILYENVALLPGALAAKDVIAGFGAYQDNLIEDFRILKSEIHWGTRTGTAGDSFMWGIAGGELSAAEIEEALEARPFNTNDNVALERSMRPVWPLGVSVLADDPSTSGGVPIEKNVRWTFANPNGWQFWVYNYTSLAMTTGTICDLFIKHFGVWVR